MIARLDPRSPLVLASRCCCSSGSARSAAVSSESRLLPGPERVWSALVAGDRQRHPDLPCRRHALACARRLCAGGAGRNSIRGRDGALGTCAAICSSRSSSSAIRSRRSRLFPVFTYIFGIGTPSKIAFTFLECLYPIVVTCYFGFRAIQTRLIWTRAEFRREPRHHPSARHPAGRLPSIFSGLRVALPVSIIVVVITEMIGDSSRARVLHHDLEYALRLRQCLCRDHRHRHLRPRARSGPAALRRRVVYWQREEA